MQNCMGELNLIYCLIYLDEPNCVLVDSRGAPTPITCVIFELT